MSGGDRYILVDRVPVPCPDLMRWAEWFETADRTVKWTKTEHHWISTVFLGLDHQHFGGGPPLVFETMSFEEEGDSVHQDRYSTWAEAETGHDMILREVLARETTVALTMLDNLVKSRLT